MFRVPNDFAEKQDPREWLQEGVRISDWLREEVELRLEAGGRYNTAVAAGLLIRHAKPVKMPKGRQQWLSILRAGSEPRSRVACSWLKSLTDEDIEMLVASAKAALHIVGPEDSLHEITKVRDDVGAVGWALWWLNREVSNHNVSRQAVDLENALWAWDPLYIPLVRERSLGGERVVSARLVEAACDLECWWALPASASFREDANLDPVTARDWDYFYRREERA